ncbi:MAG TPA: helix-turn-helix domain-containing protein, partial [Solirubrobacteraceae bacterium]|nr:helix-turn-helix domain-containing protein [Solirubrobacteraceae bacterium]
YAAATAGVRDLLGADECRVYELERSGGRLVLAAADPPAAADELGLDGRDALNGDAGGGLTVLLDLLGRREEAAPSDPAASGEHHLAAPITAGREQLGALFARRDSPWPQDADELLRAVAGQVAVALEKAALIERLTGANIVHDLFAALDARDVALSEIRAREARFDLGRRFVAVSAEPLAPAGDAALLVERIETLEAALRRIAPASVCDRAAKRLRALCPVDHAAPGGLDALAARLESLAAEARVAIGYSAPSSGAAGAARAVRDALDAERIAHALRPDGGSLAYEDLGAYRYLAHVPLDETPDDRHGAAVGVLLDYDRRRGAQLALTLERYLSTGRSVAVTARELIVHPNTLRQRLDRIESLTGLDLAAEDLLSLELALKLARLRGRC